MQAYRMSSLLPLTTIERQRKTMRAKETQADTMQFQIAPMIDVIFILILFFMCSAGAVQTEMHLSTTLPGRAVAGKPIKIPDEQIIEVHADGKVILNGRVFDSAQSHEMPQLTLTLRRFLESSRNNKAEAMVTISPQPEAPYQRIVDVLDACAAAKIKIVTFAMG